MPASRLVTFAAVLLFVSPVQAVAGPPLPAGLRSLKPYQVVEQLMAHQEMLGLSATQFDRLDALSSTIRTEKHQFTHRGGKPHRTRHVPMISRREAFEQAMAVLTPEQQQRVQGLFQAPVPAPRAEKRLTRPRGKP